jgi:hypothetical protein
VLLAHPDPNCIVIGQLPPPLAHLSGLGQANRVEIAKDLLRKLDRKCCNKINLERLRNLPGDERKLGKAELRQDALQHQLAMPGWSGGKQRPDVGDGLLILRVVLA